MYKMFIHYKDKGPRNSFDLAGLNKYIIRILYILAGLPRCESEKFRNEVMAFNIPDEEIKFLRETNEELNSLQRLTLSWFALWLMKNTYFPLYILISYNTKDIGVDNAIIDPGSSNVSSYGCLITNCTRLSNNAQLATDLIELPIFPLCHPVLSKLYTPLVSMRSTGLSILTITTFFVFIINVVYPIRNYWYSHLQDSIIYPITPVYSFRSHEERVRKYLIEIFTSMRNYMQSQNVKSYGSSFHDFRRLLVDAQHSGCKQHSMASYLKAEMKSLKLLRPMYSELNQQVKEYLGNCIPLARTYAWSLKVDRLFTIFFLSTYSVMLMFFIVAICTLIWFGTSTLEDLEQMDLYAQSVIAAFGLT